MSPIYNPNSEGVLFDEPFIGLTTFEHGLGRKAVHVSSPAYVTAAASGSGKLLTSIAHHFNLDWDLVAISPKPDLADCGIGRRADPALWESPESVRRWGRRLGTDVRGITSAWRHLTQGRVMNVDCGCQSAYPRNRYTFLCDIDLRKPTAMSRIIAIAEACFPRNPQEKDPFWTLASQGAFAGACAHVLSCEEQTARHNLVFVARRLLGIDPTTGKATAEAMMRLFKEMSLNPSLGGYVAAQGAKLASLGERTLGPLMKTVENGVRWILADPRMREVLEGPSDFSLEEFGRGKRRITAFVTPIRGDRSTEAFLSCFLSLALLVWQQRDWTPERPIALIADEVPNWGGESQVRRLTDAFNILRDKKVVPFVYGQTLAQFLSLIGSTGLDEMLAASTLCVFGVRDKTSLEFLRDRIGMTTVTRNGRREAVFVTDTDAIASELSPGSPLQYVFPYEVGQPMRLGRAAYADILTREGLHAPAINYAGHFDYGLPSYASRRRRSSK